MCVCVCVCACVRACVRVCVCVSLFLEGLLYLSVSPLVVSGDHVPGSPFSLRVAGAPDPSKVRVYGPGIEHGVLATFQSRFICDTRGAGAGQLTVRIRGPKGL